MADVITSLRNPAVQHLVRLRERRHRDRSGTFLVEGVLEVDRALQAGAAVEQLVIGVGQLGSEDRPLSVSEALGQGVPLLELGDAAFRKVSYRQNSDGLLAVVRRFPTGPERLVPPAPALLLVAESIEKPGNLGAMLRAADAAGAGGVAVADPTTDVFNPNVVRASRGALFTVPLAVGDSKAVRDRLADLEIAPVALDPAADKLLWEIDLTGPVALVVGSEHAGLSAVWGDSQSARLPMAGTVDSLNAATTAGIALFEAVRQRSLTR
ncbi:MAG TPA: TrmH family RNA methyltransferase [Acidimicrobiia bacterium]|nr:TrmH family RNA methyltransferase [Acidimicrobiia bacterium]